jgi:hypothetical protein
LSKLEADWPDDFGFFAVVSLFVQTRLEWETTKLSLLGTAIRFATAVIQRVEKNNADGIASFSPTSMGSGALGLHRRRQRAVSFESQGRGPNSGGGGDASPWPFGVDETSCASWASAQRDDYGHDDDDALMAPVSPAVSDGGGGAVAGGAGASDEAGGSSPSMAVAISRRAAMLEVVCRPLFACLCLVDVLHKAIKSDDADEVPSEKPSACVVKRGSGESEQPASAAHVVEAGKKEGSVCDELKSWLMDETRALGKLEGAIINFRKIIGESTSTKVLPSTSELASAMGVDAETLNRMVQVAMDGPRDSEVAEK